MSTLSTGDQPELAASVGQVHAVVAIGTIVFAVAEVVPTGEEAAAEVSTEDEIDDDAAAAGDEATGAAAAEEVIAEAAVAAGSAVAGTEDDAAAAANREDGSGEFWVKILVRVATPATLTASRRS